MRYRRGLAVKLMLGLCCVGVLTCKPTYVQAMADTDIVAVQEEDISQYLTFDNRLGKLDKDAEDDIRKAFAMTYKNICDYFNDGIIIPVEIVISDDCDVAYTSGSQITISSNYFNNHPGDCDAVTHELVHVAQAYGALRNDYIWMVEGLADYGRNLFGINNKAVGWKLEKPDVNSYYTNGYTTAAAFFAYVDENYCKDFAKLLNGALKNGSYSDSFWKENTDYELDELWEKYLAANGIEISVADVQIPTPQPIPSDIDIDAYLTVKDEDNALDATVLENMKKVFHQQYAAICTEYNNGVLRPVTLVVDSSYQDVAYTSDSKIVVNPEYYSRYPEDYDSFTHELIHVAQAYKYGGPGWLVESIADYGRYQFGINNLAANWEINGNCPHAFEKGKSEMVYKHGAGFLLWVCNEYNSNAVKILNQSLKNGTYSVYLWKQITGVSYGSLVTAFASHVPESVEIGKKISDAYFYDENGNRVLLSSFVDRTTVVYLGDWDENILGTLNIYNKIDRLYGDDVRLIIVSAYENNDRHKQYLDEWDGQLREKTIFLSDRNFAVISNLILKHNDDGSVGFGWPTAVILSEEREVLYISGSGCTHTMEMVNEGRQNKEDPLDCLKKIMGGDKGENPETPEEQHTHTWDEGTVTKQPTKTSEGVRTYKCSDCGEFKTESIPKLPSEEEDDKPNPSEEEHIHIWNEGEVVLQPTEESEGVKIYKCKDCNEVKTEILPKLSKPTEEPEGDKPDEKAPSISKVKSVKVTAGKKKISVKWKKNSKASGYEIQYSLKSNFSGKKTVKVKGASKVSTTIKNLKKGKTYYVRVRAYKTSGGKKYTSAWSANKKVKVK